MSLCISPCPVPHVSISESYDWLQSQHLPTIEPLIALLSIRQCFVLGCPAVRVVRETRQRCGGIVSAALQGSGDCWAFRPLGTMIGFMQPVPVVGGACGGRRCQCIRRWAQIRIAQLHAPRLHRSPALTLYPLSQCLTVPIQRTRGIAPSASSSHMLRCLCISSA